MQEKKKKSKRQLRRNWSINQAKRLIEADPNSTGKHVNVLWKVGNDKSRRQIEVAGEIAFDQLTGDLSGSFGQKFAHLSLE